MNIIVKYTRKMENNAQMREDPENEVEARFFDEDLGKSVMDVQQTSATIKANGNRLFAVFSFNVIEVENFIQKMIVTAKEQGEYDYAMSLGFTKKYNLLLNSQIKDFFPEVCTLIEANTKLLSDYGADSKGNAYCFFAGNETDGYTYTDNRPDLAV